MSDQAHGREAVKPLGVKEDARVHLGAKGGGLCLRPATVSASPALANGQGLWVGRGRGGERELARRRGERSGKVPGPLDWQCRWGLTSFGVIGVGGLWPKSLPELRKKERRGAIEAWKRL